MTIVVQPLRRPDDWSPPWRLKPRHGPPRCLIEQFSQYVWTHLLLVYVAVAITVSVLLQIYWHPR